MYQKYPDPTTYISRLTSSQNVYRYPKNVGDKNEGLHHFMIIKEYKFNEEQKDNDLFNGITSFENNINFSDASFTDLYRQINSFILYLPQGSLRTVYTADYQDVEIGFFGNILQNNLGFLTDELKSAYQSYVNSEEGFMGKSLDFYSSIGSSLMDVGEVAYKNYMKDVYDRYRYNALQFGGAFLSPFTDVSAKDFATQTMRKLQNPYTSLVFTGVKSLRQHSFSFDFRPKSKDDSKNVLRIIAKLKMGMLPSLPTNNGNDSYTVQIDDPSLADVEKHEKLNPTEQKKSKDFTLTVQSKMPSLFFKIPNVYTIRFYDFNGNTSGNVYLHSIGQSVLESISVKYGNSFFESTALPTNITMNLSFKENFAINRQRIEEGY